MGGDEGQIWSVRLESLLYLGGDMVVEGAVVRCERTLIQTGEKNARHRRHAAGRRAKEPALCHLYKRDPGAREVL